MLTNAMAGSISLNCSFILYLVVYLPQIYNNRNLQRIASLSLGMHYILYFSCCLDLFYGFSSHLQWQYKTVSVMSVIVLTIQHLQLTASLWLHKNWLWFNLNLLFIAMFSCTVFYFFIPNQGKAALHITLLMGYSSHIGFLLCTLPQILKNAQTQSANAISITFIYLSLILSCLDMISACCLDWGWPNKFGSLITTLLMLILFIQAKKYNVCKPCTAEIQKFRVAQNQNFI